MRKICPYKKRHDVVFDDKANDEIMMLYDDELYNRETLEYSMVYKRAAGN